MKRVLLAVAVAVLASSSATAQDVFASRGGGARLNSEPAPDEQRDPSRFHAYMIRQGYCPDSPGLHPAWHACAPGETPGSRANTAAQTQSPRRVVDRVLNGGLGLANVYARAGGFGPLEVGPARRNAGTGVIPFSRSFVPRSNAYNGTANNGTNFYQGYAPQPGRIVQRPPQFGIGTIERPKGFLLNK